jgi:oligopeptide transport system ATP-binding protein
MSPLLEVKNLHVTFNTKQGVVQAVNGISYELEKGEVLAIVGESGSGKSVSVLALQKLLPMPPARIPQGEVLFEGRDMLQMNKRQLRHIRGNEIGMIFQDPLSSLNPIIPIGRQITEALQIHQRLTAQQARNRAIDLLKLVGIPAPQERLNNYPFEFSGGMRQRVMIAIGISCNPKLLIADEPTTALDVTVQAQILRLVKQLRNEIDMSIIWITHDLGVVSKLVDRVIVMYAGQIVEAAGVREFYRDPRHPYSLGLLASLPTMNARQSGHLKSIEGAPPSLTNLPPGCAFYDRCGFRIQSCKTDNPPLTRVTPNHSKACWVDTSEPVTAKKTQKNGTVT